MSRFLILVVILLPLSRAARVDVQPAGCEAAPDQEHLIARHLPDKDIRNFGEVTPFLYRGGQPSREGLQRLADMGFSIVVNNAGQPNDEESKEVERLGMKYVVIRWHCPFPHDEPFARFLKLVQENPGKKIFIHCRLGDDRTGMMIAAYRMAIEGWSAEEAMREMREFGFRGWHRLICPAMAPYERHFPERFRHNHAFDAIRPKCGQK